MENYKLGNRVKVIMRAWCSCKIGDYTLTYDNEPFLILQDIDVKLGYRNKIAEATSGQDTVLSYNADVVSEVLLDNIPISDKILSLIYSKNEVKLCNVAENCLSDEDGMIFLSVPSNTIYQVFIYSSGQLEKAYGTLDISNGIQVQQANEKYTICYSYEGQLSVNLDRPENYYVSLDFEILGNVNDSTSRMWLHLDKCSPVATKQLSFGDKVNTISLRFRVINDSTTNNYITLK